MTVPARRRLWLARALLSSVVGAASFAANAAAPVLNQDTVVSWPDPNAVGFNSRLPANTTITKHQYRYKIWNGSEIPASWTRDWTDLLLANTRCHVATNPGTPSETRTPEATGAACATTGSDATKHYRFITKVPNLPNGARFHFEVRAVNNDGNSDTVEFNIALPADPSAIVTIPDAVLEGYLRERAVARVPSIGTNPMTQLDLARVRVILENVGAGTAVNRVRSFEGIQHALNLELLLIANHQVLDFQRLAGLHMLRVINNNGSLLSDVSPLQNVVSLEELYLNRGRTYPPPGVCTGTAAGPVHGQTPWPPAANCPPGQVDDVVVKDLSSLRRLTKLRRLWLCDQRVNPQHLTTFVNMEAMSYCRNDLSDISGMRNLTKMETLYLFENHIEDVSPLARMAELQFLQLHDNNIRDVSSLSGLTKLRHIYLSDNPLDAGTCSTGGHATRAACTDASGTWTTSVVSTLTPLVTGSCSVAGQTTEADCTSNSGTWTAGALKLIDLRGDTQLTDADVAALSGLTGVTVLHDADIRPAAPRGLSASSTARTATLRWTDPSNAAIAAYQYRHRQSTGPWSDWRITTGPESSFHYWNRGDPALASLAVYDLPGGASTVELRAVVASDYNNARNRNSDGSSFSTIKTHQTAVNAAAVGAGRWDVGRVLTPGAATSTLVILPARASIASTAPAVLTETYLDGATVVVELSGTTFGASLTASNFQLTTTPTIAGLTIASVLRTSDTRAELTLRFDHTNFDLQSTLAVRVLAAALGSDNDLGTQTVTVVPNLDMSELADAQLAVGETLVVDLRGAFRSTNALTYSALTSNPAVVTAATVGYTLVLTGVTNGVATVTVSVSDSLGRSMSQTLTATVGAVLSLVGQPTAGAPAVPDYRAGSAAEGGTVRVQVRLSVPRGTPTAFTWRVLADADPATADADAGEHGDASGMATIAAGATSTEIAIAIADDAVVEPAREWFVVELVSDAVALGRSRLSVVVLEGVCDRSAAVASALAGGRGCETPTPAELAGVQVLGMDRSGIEALGANDLAGLTGLRTLSLRGNALTTLPDGLSATPNLRSLLLGGNRLSSLDEDAFAGLSALSGLDLSDNALSTLPGGVLAGLSALRRLRLDGNALKTLPDGLFAGVGSLRSARLGRNPGSPFALRVELRRTDARPDAAGPATVRAELATGAPFAVEVGLSAEGGELLAATGSPFAAGETSGAEVGVRAARPGAVRVTPTPGAVPNTICDGMPCWDGLAMAAGDPLVLFVAPPVVGRAPIPPASLFGDDLRLALSSLASAGGAPVERWQASSSDPSVATVRIVGGELVVEPQLGAEGEVEIEVVATDGVGQTATVRFSVQVEFHWPQRQGAGWRGAVGTVR